MFVFINSFFHFKIRNRATQTSGSSDALTHEAQESRRHTTVARKGAPISAESRSSLSRVAHQFPSFPSFHFGEKAESNPPRQTRDIFLPRHAGNSQRDNRQQRQYRSDVFLPQSQRFFPSFNPHPPQRESHNRQTFFPSGPYLGARGGGPSPFPSRSPSFRSHRGHEAVHSPKFAFASNKYKEHGPVDNSILGSGNFEVIKGGTFYDNDDPHLNHNPYDPYLDNSYVVFPSGNPHTHNHVDDFFSNFRDFSEFANRRSGTMNQAYRRDGVLEPGFASEHVAQISTFEVEDMMTSESKANANETLELHPKTNKRIQEISPSKALIYVNKKKEKESKKQKKFSNSKKAYLKIKKPTKSKNNSKNQRPQNIQDVLEKIDPFPSIVTAATTKKNNSFDEENDPLIATF